MTSSAQGRRASGADQGGPGTQGPFASRAVGVLLTLIVLLLAVSAILLWRVADEAAKPKLVAQQAAPQPPPLPASGTRGSAGALIDEFDRTNRQIRAQFG